MATYNKKAKSKVVSKTTDIDFVEDKAIEKTSFTAKLFSKLDFFASKSESVFEENQKKIVGLVSLIALVTVGYLGYQKFIALPKEQEAFDNMFVAQQQFEKASNGLTANDSLYKLALNGDLKKPGFLKIIQDFNGTNAGNLAKYYAGISYLNIKKFDEAIKYLTEFKSKDIILSTLAIGAIGDAYSEKNDLKKALEYYVKASENNQNDFTTPRFLMKAGKIALQLGNKSEALKYFTKIKEQYDNAPEASNIDAYIGLAQ